MRRIIKFLTSLFYAFLYVSGLAIIAFAFYIIIRRFNEIRALNVADLVQVIAGVATVYALVFLILGYRQQGKELAQNTEALRMQAEELKKSVEQAEELVKVTRNQLELDQKSRVEEAERIEKMQQPFFTIDEERCRGREARIIVPEGNGLREAGLRLPLANTGAQVMNVEFELSSTAPKSVSPHFLPKFESGQEILLHLHFDSTNSSLVHQVMLIITYRTLIGTEGTVYFKFGENTRGHIRNIRYDSLPPS